MTIREYFCCNKFVTDTLTKYGQDPKDIIKFKSFVDGCTHSEFAPRIGMGLLSNVIYYNKIHAVKYLINTGKYTHEMFGRKLYDGQNIFFDACSHERPEILLYLLGTDFITSSLVDTRDVHGTTPFDYVCRYYHRELSFTIVKEMIKSGKMTYRTFLNNDGFIDLSKFTSLQMMDIVLESGIIPDEVLLNTKSARGDTSSVLFSNIRCKINLLHLIQSGKITDEIINVKNSQGQTFIECAKQSNDKAWTYELYKSLANVSTCAHTTKMFLDKLNEEERNVNTIRNAIMNGQLSHDAYVDNWGIVSLRNISSIPMMDMLLETGFITIQMLNKVCITNNKEYIWFTYDVTDRVHTIMTHNINNQILLLHLLKNNKIEDTTVEANCNSSFTFATEAYKNPLNASWINEVLDCNVITCEFVRFLAVPYDGETKHTGRYPSVVYRHPKYQNQPIVEFKIKVEDNDDYELELEILRNGNELLKNSIELIKCKIEQFNLTCQME